MFIHSNPAYTNNKINSEKNHESCRWGSTHSRTDDRYICPPPPQILLQIYLFRLLVTPYSCFGLIHQFSFDASYLYLFIVDIIYFVLILLQFINVQYRALKLVYSPIYQEWNQESPPPSFKIFRRLFLKYQRLRS